MLKKTIIAASVSISLLLSGCSSMNSLLGTENAVPPALQQQNEKLVSEYTNASKYVLEGQKDLVNALGATDATADIDSQLKLLNSKNLDASDINKTMSNSEDINDIILTVLSAENLPVGEQGKVAVGLAKYATGVVYTARLGKETANFADMSKKAIDNASALEKASIIGGVSSGTTIAGKLPQLSKNLIDTGEKFINYAKEAGVDTSEAQKTIAAALAL